MTQVLGAQAWYVCHSIEGRLHTGPLSFRAGEGTVGIRSCTQIKNFILKSLTMYMYTGKFIWCVHVSVNNTFCVYIFHFLKEYFFFYWLFIKLCVNTNIQTIILVTFRELNGLTDHIHYDIYMPITCKLLDSTIIILSIIEYSPSWI